MKTRLPTSHVAQALGVTEALIREYARAGMLRGTTTSGEVGRGRRLWFDPDEVEAFRTGGAPAAKAYRERQARKVKA